MLNRDRHPHTLSRQKGNIFKHSLDVMELRKCNFLPIELFLNDENMWDFVNAFLVVAR